MSTLQTQLVNSCRIGQPVLAASSNKYYGILWGQRFTLQVATCIFGSGKEASLARVLFDGVTY